VVKEIPIGEIEIGKDNSEILNNSRFCPCNKGINWMTNGETCTGINPDGTITKILKTLDGIGKGK
jgi:hypothetical protein